MPLIAPTFEMVVPSFMMPQIVVPYSQVSGAFELTADGGPRVLLGEDDYAVYLPRLDMRSRMAAGQALPGQMELPSPEIVANMISAPTYRQQVAFTYDRDDIAAAARYNFSLDAAMRLACQQTHAQYARLALLYGYNPANGEGFLNATGATAVNLPPDSNGNTTISTYDNGQLAFYLLTQMLQIKNRTYNLGIGRRFVFCGPQETLGPMAYNVVQLVQFQRAGAGTASTVGTVNQVADDNGDTVMWVYDDTLKGKGAGGTDAIIIAMPEVATPSTPRLNTNKFAQLQPNLEACMLQLTDMVAPMEITSPLPRGGTDVLTRMRVTSGWAIRPEALTILSAAA